MVNLPINCPLVLLTVSDSWPLVRLGDSGLKISGLVLSCTFSGIGWLGRIPRQSTMSIFQDIQKGGEEICEPSKLGGGMEQVHDVWLLNNT